jgi:hypothetical protein
MDFLHPINEPAKNHQSFAWVYWMVIGLSLAIGALQIFFLPYINLAEGLGYDGVWYYVPANEFLPRTDNYHIFRLLPATLVFFLKKIIFSAHNYHDTVKAFQVFNLICNAASFWLAYRIGRHLNFSGIRMLLLFVFLFFNFHVLKDEIFNPVMTDTTVLFLSLLLLWAYLSRTLGLYLLASLMLLFTFPVGGFILQLVFLTNTAGSISEKRIIPDKWLNYLFLAGAGLFLFATSLVVFGFGRTTVLTFPDEINIYLFPFSVSLIAFLIYKILNLHQSLFQHILHVALKPRMLRSWFLLIFLAELLIYLALPSFNKFPAKGFTGNFTIAPLIYVTFKPFIGIFDNCMFFGPVVMIFLWKLPEFVRKNAGSISALFVSLSFCFFVLKPEARHMIFLLPFLSIAAVKSIPEASCHPKYGFIIALICLLFSKFWYPCHLAEFPPGYEIFTSKVNHAIFQDFPAQHYFMFQGPMISHQNYFIWFLVMIPLAWYCRKILTLNH